MEFRFNNLTDLLLTFNTEEKCKAYFEQQRWKGKICCPHCNHNETIYRTTKGFKCGNPSCYKKFTVTVGTVFEGTHIKLQKWYAAIYLFTAHKKGISSCQLGRDIGVSQKTAWFMLHRIREIFTVKDEQKMKGTVQGDETFIGGKTKNMHKWQRDVVHAGGSSAIHANPVFGLIADGIVRAIPVPSVDGATLMPIMDAIVEKGATLVTDGHGSYYEAKKNFIHKIINHEQGEFVKDGFHTNNIESFWAHFKRTILGTYYHVSGKHLNRYCDESTFRFNLRGIEDSLRFAITLENTNGKLTYKQLVQE